MSKINIILSSLAGLSSFCVCFYALYTISPIDGLLKFILYSFVSFLLCIYIALYIGARKIDMKAVGIEFYEMSRA
jgi:hypothetical protein